MTIATAYIGLGASEGPRVASLRGALEALEALDLDLVARSAVWETEPVDAPGSGWFLNMVVAARTGLQPGDLLQQMLAIEVRSGRRRTVRNGPRTLDLDLLVMGQRQIDAPGLILPHPRMWDRRFVLEPLAEIAPDLTIPGQEGTVAGRRRALRHSSSVRRLGDLAALDEQPL